MRVSAVRMSDDLFRLLESEAHRVGVSVSQYVREAALARAVAAAARRGEDPYDVLARAAGQADSGPGAEWRQRRRSAIEQARMLRGQASEAVDSAHAVIAESEQTSRRRDQLKLPPHN